MAIPLTIQDDINAGKALELSHRNFNGAAILHYQSTDQTILIPIEPLINKYKEYFDNYIMEIPLLESEAREFRFAPKKLSYWFYGTTQYWSIILFINECHSVIDFEPTESVRLIDKGKIEKIINELMILEGII